MAKLNKTRTVAAALLGTIVLAAPVTSFAQDFRTVSNGFDNCRVDNRNNQIAGGVFGAVVGGVLGSQLSSRRARTGSTLLVPALAQSQALPLAERLVIARQHKCVRSIALIRFLRPRLCRPLEATAL